MFLMRDGWGERMWVEVTDVRKRRIVGTLRNLPVGIPRLVPGDKIKFKRDHIIGIRGATKTATSQQPMKNSKIPR